MRYYLPTTTTNFNNILSTESISPRAFYPKRRFGYSNFQSVSPNNVDEVVLLYNKYPVFELSKTEEAAYPMVIEIYVDDNLLMEGFRNAYFCSFYSESTIYLNPLKARFLFRDTTEMVATINSSERSIETKLIKLYSTAFAVVDNSAERFIWDEMFSNEVAHQIPVGTLNTQSQIGIDIAIDRLKGMMYGFVIGANRSKDNKSYSDLLVLISRLNNSLSSFINVQGNRNAEGSYRECESLLNNINSQLIEYKKPEIKTAIIEHFRPCARTIVDKLGTKYPDEENRRNDEDLVIDEVCRQYVSDDFYKYIWNKEASRFCQRPFSGKAVVELQRYISSLKATVSSFFPGQKIELSQLPILAQKQVQNIPSEKDLLSSLLNKLLRRHDLIDLIASSRYEFAVVGGTIFKELMGDKWDGEYRNYINGLLKNLNENSPFDISSTNSSALKSFAALCKKGEKGELESYYDYLIANGIGDVKIAFTLWGAVFGFAYMPKTVTKELFDDSDDIYISEIYKHVHKQLFGEELIGELNFAELPKVPEMPQMPVEEISKDSGLSRDVSETPDGSNGYLSDFEGKKKDELMEIAAMLGLKKSGTKAELIERIRVGNHQQDLFNTGTSIQKNYTSSDIESSSNCGGQFYCDDRAFEKVKVLVRPEAQSDLKMQIEWFQRTHKDGYYDKKNGERVYVNDHSNFAAIEGFKKNLYGGLKNKWLKLTEDEVESVVVRLKELYIRQRK